MQYPTFTILSRLDYNTINGEGGKKITMAIKYHCINTSL